MGTITRRLTVLVAPGALFAVFVILGCNSNPSTISGTSPAPPAPVAAKSGFFEDVTAQTGIDFTFRNGQEAGNLAILESLGGGVALIDYDQDGLLDIFIPGGGYYKDKTILGHPCKLYKNLGNFKFKDVTAEVGLDKIDFYTHGATVGDYDNDGWPDLLVTGWGRTALFHNNHGKFEDVTEKAGIKTKDEWHWSTSAGFADFNGDGLPDLYVCHYVNWHITKNHPPCKDSAGLNVPDVCSPKQFKPLQHYLYLNNGDGTFRDATEKANIKRGKGLGVVIADLNHDGKPDIYVANDTEDNYLYLNQGDGVFKEVGTELSVSRDEDGVPNGSMGVDVADYNGSGYFSIFVTNYQQESHALYRNRGPRPGAGAGDWLPFNWASTHSGIKAIGLTYVGFGTSFLDFDLDGSEDIVITNGHVVRFPPPPGTLKQKPVLLRNSFKAGMATFDVRFQEVSSKELNEAGPFFQTPHTGRGLAVGDLDNDGRLDIVFSNLNEPVNVLRNVGQTGHHWIGVQAVGKPNRDAVGAELVLDVGGRKLVRQVKAGGSYLSAGDRRIVFGLGTVQQADKLTIKWPSGQTQTFEGADLSPDHYYRLLEGEAKPQAFPAPKPSTGKD